MASKKIKPAGRGIVFARVPAGVILSARGDAVKFDKSYDGIIYIALKMFFQLKQHERKDYYKSLPRKFGRPISP